MSDLISRQAAIDALERKKDKNAKGEIGSFYNTIIQHDLDVIVELPSAQPEPKWIPCSERLPEDGTYLVYAPCYTGGSSSAKEWYNGVMFSKCKNGKWSIEHGYYSRPNCVVAWMPLPEPYKMDGKEQNDEID